MKRNHHLWTGYICTTEWYQQLWDQRFLR